MVVARKAIPVDVDCAIDNRVFHRCGRRILGMDAEDIENDWPRGSLHRALTRAESPSIAMLTSVPLCNPSRQLPLTSLMITEVGSGRCFG